MLSSEPAAKQPYIEYDLFKTFLASYLHPQLFFLQELGAITLCIELMYRIWFVMPGFKFQAFTFISLQALVAGKLEIVEEKLRAIFKTAIGADSVGESDDIKEGVTYNKHKGVFQATMKFPDQAVSIQKQQGYLINFCLILLGVFALYQYLLDQMFGNLQFLSNKKNIHRI